MKYVVCMVLDQTWGYLDENGGSTISHPEAKLFDTFGEAQAAAIEHDRHIPAKWPDGAPLTERDRQRFTAWIDEVTDVEEFRKRPDTW